MQLSEDTVNAVPAEQFSEYVSRLNTYLQVNLWQYNLLDRRRSGRTALVAHMTRFDRS